MICLNKASQEKAQAPSKMGVEDSLVLTAQKG